MTRCLFILLLLSSFLNSLAQTRRIDSLRSEVNLAENRDAKKSIILGLLLNYRALSNDTLRHYADYLKSVSADDARTALWADVYKVYYYTGTASFDSAVQVATSGVRRAAAINDKGLLLYFRYLLAFSKVKQSNHRDALKYFFETLQMAEKYTDTAFQVRSLNGIGWTYMEMGQSTEALQWINKAIAIGAVTKNEPLLGVVYLNKSSCCGMEGHIDSATYYERLAYRHAERYDDLQTMANALAVRTNILAYYERYEEALRCIKQAVVIRKLINDPFYVVSDMVILADCYSWLHQWKEGVGVANEAISIARKNNLYIKLPLLYSALANNYRKAGDYKQLAEVLQHYAALKDTVYQKVNAKELAEMQTRYETEKREAAITLLQKENELKDIRNRNHLYITVALAIIFLTSGMFFYAFLHTRQKRKLAQERAAQEMKRLQEVIQTQEIERKRISAELHDGVGPVLSAIKLNLGQMSHAETDHRKYEKAMQLIDESYKELRNISHQLMPAILLKKGLISALEELAESVNSSDILKMTIDSDDCGRRYSNSLEINLYRIIQELVNNMLKYSGASEAQIQISHEPAEVSIMIEDNGRGYDPSLLYQSTSNGWNNIISRLNIINGTIEIDSQPGKKGTVVFLNAPIV